MSQNAWMITTVIAVLGVIGMYAAIRPGLKKMQSIQKGFQPLQLRFRYTEKDAAEAVQSLGEGGAKMLRTFSLLFLPMLFFAGLCLAVVAHNAAPYAWLRRVMYALAALGCCFGGVETLLLPSRAKAAGTCSLLKWVCFGIWTLGMFAGLFIKGWSI